MTTSTRERPILFSGEMVRALLAGTKTQTRRIVKTPPLAFCAEVASFVPAPYYDHGRAGEFVPLNAIGGIASDTTSIPCPYGVPGDREWRTGPMPGTGWYYVRGLLDASTGGDSRAVWVDPESFTWGFDPPDDPEAIQLDTDITPENVQWKRLGTRLWVREAAYIAPPNFGERTDCNCVDADGRPRLVGYAASMDWESVRCATDYGVRKTPSIHMPRWASRITLEITGVRVERVQSISEEDAIAEGIPKQDRVGVICPSPIGPLAIGTAPHRNIYALLWDRINGKRDGASWASNPWVWVIAFRRIKP